ncbi:protein GLUTAMINE DUMPER 2-like [Cynara cardunculus var. scolymus]|uniref:protein GLUTAMINE DUMPER 2-like n=1 Tax=Cynara cardunculus var. scolymus TaxID=59895 RepID=UPI000D62BA19|nr:protein GLUTAMINE DUMPER 2-like [Cynara cardunculus var. scolymus]
MTPHTPSSMAPSSPVVVQRSPWHSPVPYLFGGLAALMGLIAFALLILACSYSNHSDDVENDAEGNRDLEAGDSKPENHKETHVLEEKYLVIMAGQARPTFVATPISSRASSFGSCSSGSNWSEKSSTSEMEMIEENEKEKQGSSDHIQVRNTENQLESIDQLH